MFLKMLARTWFLSSCEFSSEQRTTKNEEKTIDELALSLSTHQVLFSETREKEKYSHWRTLFSKRRWGLILEILLQCEFSSEQRTTKNEEKTIDELALSLSTQAIPLQCEFSSEQRTTKNEEKTVDELALSLSTQQCEFSSEQRTTKNEEKTIDELSLSLSTQQCEFSSEQRTTKNEEKTIDELALSLSSQQCESSSKQRTTKNEEKTIDELALSLSTQQYEFSLKQRIVKKEEKMIDELALSLSTQQVLFSETREKKRTRIGEPCFPSVDGDSHWPGSLSLHPHQYEFSSKQRIMKKEEKMIDELALSLSTQQCESSWKQRTTKNEEKTIDELALSLSTQQVLFSETREKEKYSRWRTLFSKRRWGLTLARIVILRSSPVCVLVEAENHEERRENDRLTSTVTINVANIIQRNSEEKNKQKSLALL
ncbi:zonadhesin-like [Maniola hyperantus]|uniref:zonadhesin-like n=1 Tax=Aphantopus hyperantus TaxID=2795564 RepID=UPI0037483652